MPNNVLFKRVSSLDDVSKCKDSDIVFCESTGEVYTHSTRYGVPTITEIGDENPNADIQMISNQEVKSKSTISTAEVSSLSTSSLAPEPELAPVPLNISINEPKAEAGYIRYNGSSYSPDEFRKMNIKSTEIIDGVHVDESTIVDLKDSGIHEWGIVGVDVMSNKFGSLSEAINDMDGVRNSNILTSYKSTLFDVVNDGWYVPSLGELDKLHSVLDSIQSSLELCDGNKLLTSYYWSSTSGTNNQSAWAYEMSSGTGQLGYRTSKLAVRRFKKI